MISVRSSSIHTIHTHPGHPTQTGLTPSHPAHSRPTPHVPQHAARPYPSPSTQTIPPFPSTQPGLNPCPSKQPGLTTLPQHTASQPPAPNIQPGYSPPAAHIWANQVLASLKRTTHLWRWNTGGLKTILSSLPLQTPVNTFPLSGAEVTAHHNIPRAQLLSVTYEYWLYHLLLHSLTKCFPLSLSLISKGSR
ncbi:hypothetical protein E2C01_066209 [Portunus trituberculatus]|uniref:Uncharacterized protein n=1 Tax=Portunus trituberculatus TaxID=210409 RepID=A0A5B7HRP5_PORTR|nr:hypothetical protein [Portunus trituberculatus]